MKDIPSFEGRYAATEDGRIWSHRRSQFLAPYTNPLGYVTVTLYHDKRRDTHLLHRLIATTFLLKDNDLLHVNHLDGNKTNNHIDNLEWVTRAENMQHAARTGLLSSRTLWPKNGAATLSAYQVLQIRRDAKAGVKVPAMTSLYGVSKATIFRIKSGSSWKHLPL